MIVAAESRMLHLTHGMEPSTPCGNGALAIVHLRTEDKFGDTFICPVGLIINTVIP